MTDITAALRLGIAGNSAFTAKSLLFLLFTTLVFQPCSAVTVYYLNGQTPLSAAPTTTANPGVYTGFAAYNPVVLSAPSPPGAAALPTQFPVQLTNAVPTQASIPQNGSFFGFSIEMSVVNQVLGTNASILQVPFLNLMSNLQQRVGQINIRVGGNTQETAALVASTPDGKILEKDVINTSNPTQTPPLIYTRELLYMLNNISSLVNVKWYLGIPFFNTNPFDLDIAEVGQQILGNNLIGLQAANEPDLYGKHGHRDPSYSQQDFFNEFGQLITQMSQNQSIPNQNMLIGPSISGTWTPESVWNTGFVSAYSANLAFLTVEHYPADNCAAVFPQPGIPAVNPQDVFASYMNHANVISNISAYLNSSSFALQNQKQFHMFETNTASCGGFPGVSDSFGAALWGADTTLQMAAAGFSGALYHVGGQGVSYNPFIPPPTNQSTFHQWSIGPIYYSSLVVAEALGATGTAQVMDLGANSANVFSPAYGIWENNNTLARVVLFNYASDSTGASDLSVSLSLTDAQMPGQVQVKYLQASSVSQKGNFTWAGQTFGGLFQSDGRPIGQESVQTVQCSSASGTSVCVINVPAPSIALVFIASGALNENAGGPSKTFATTATTRLHNTVMVDPSVLATSNGHSGLGGELGSTSPGSVGGDYGGPRVAPWMVGLGLLMGIVMMV